MNQKNKLSVQSMVLCALFAALLCVLGPVSIPIGPVPVTFHTFIVSLVGYILGSGYGAISTIIYLVIGMIGVPVFSGGTAGVAHIAGSTGGYLYGFIFLALLCGIRAFTKKQNTAVSYVILLLQGIVGLLLVYVLGTIQFCLVTKNTVWQALSVCVIPFMAKDIISIFVACVLAKAIKRALNSAGISLMKA